MGLIQFAWDGDWTVRSESDPRWNGRGRTFWAVTGGIPPEAKDHINSLKDKLGEPPEDLSYSFWKD